MGLDTVVIIEIDHAQSGRIAPISFPNKSYLDGKRG